jgi:hypothetical protein
MAFACKESPEVGKCRSGEKYLPIKRFDLAFYFNEQGIALAISRLPGLDFNPALADAIFFNIGALIVINLNTDIVFEYGRIEVRAAGID